MQIISVTLIIKIKKSSKCYPFLINLIQQSGAIVEDSINHKIPYVIYPVYNKLTYPVMYQCEIQTYAHHDQLNKQTLYPFHFSVVQLIYLLLISPTCHMHYENQNPQL